MLVVGLGLELAELILVGLLVILLTQPTLKELRLKTYELSEKGLRVDEEKELAQLKAANPMMLAIATWAIVVSLMQIVLLPLGPTLASIVQFGIIMLFSFALTFDNILGRLAFRVLVQSQVFLYQVIKTYFNKRQQVDESVIEATQQAVESRLHQSAQALIKGFKLPVMIGLLALALLTLFVTEDSLPASYICLMGGFVMGVHRAEKSKKLALDEK